MQKKEDFFDQDLMSTEEEHEHPMSRHYRDEE